MGLVMVALCPRGWKCFGISTVVPVITLMKITCFAGTLPLVEATMMAVGVYFCLEMATEGVMVVVHIVVVVVDL